MRLSPFLLFFLPPLRWTLMPRGELQAASPSVPAGAEGPPCAFSGVLSGAGVQPGTLVWLTHALTLNVHWLSPQGPVSQVGSPSLQVTLFEPVAPWTSNSAKQSDLALPPPGMRTLKPGRANP